MMLRQLAAEIAATYTDNSADVIHELFKGEIGHATPKVGVRGAVFREGKLLLVRERSDNGWTLPGGWADVGESASEAVEKEIEEESGFKTRAVKLLSLDDLRKRNPIPHPFHIYRATFLCELISGEATTSFETSEVAFFGRDEIPNDLSFARVTHAQIQRCFEHFDNPEWSTEFD